MKGKKLKYKSTSDKSSALVNETSLLYQAKSKDTLKIFNSFEELENDNYRWLATLTPSQHLQNATSLIKRIFAENLKQHPYLGNELIID